MGKKQTENRMYILELNRILLFSRKFDKIQSLVFAKIRALRNLRLTDTVKITRCFRL